MAWVVKANLKGPKGDAGGWEKGIVPFNSNINDWHTSAYDGSWTVNSNAHAATITGLPVGVPCQVLKLPGVGHQIVTSYVEDGDEPSIYFRGITNVTSKTWSAWERLNSLGTDTQPRLLTSGANIDFYYAIKRGYTYEINTQAVADTITGLPGDKRPGILKNFKSTGFQTYMEYGADPRFWFRGISNVTLKTWGPWKDMTGGGSAVGNQSEVAAQHMVRADTIRKQMGYKIGTRGRGVIMLRFDDYPQDFKNTVLPLLRANALPCYLATTVRHFEELQPTPWSEVQGWAINDGVQPWNHSWTHSAATSPAALTKEIVESADYFESKMPQVRIGGWVMPGTGVTGDPYGGYSGKTDEAFYGTVAGRLILSRHGVVNAARGGSMQPAGGHPIGQAHSTFEAWTVEQFKAAVTEASVGGYGLSLMAHPANFGNGGYMTVAQLSTCLAWLATERTAGRVMVLTGHASAVLDPDSDYRHNLLPESFADGLGAWSGTGWTVADGIAKSPATTAALTRTLDTASTAWARGGTRELHALVKSAAANTIKLEAIGTGGVVTASRTQAIPAGAWTDVRKFFTLPYVGDPIMTIRISSTTGVTFDVHQINAYAA